MGGAAPRAESSAPATKKARVAAPSNPFANYSTAQQLGFVDDEPFIPPGARDPRTGEAGQWQTVTAPPVFPRASTSTAAPPPPPPAPVDAEEQPTFRAFQEKSASLADDDELYDVGEIKLKRRPGEATDAVKAEEATMPGDGEPKPKFRPIRFSASLAPAPVDPEPAPGSAVVDDARAEAEAEAEAKPAKVDEVAVPEADASEIKPAAPAVEVAPSLFKKRKRPKP